MSSTTSIRDGDRKLKWNYFDNNIFASASTNHFEIFNITPVVTVFEDSNKSKFQTKKNYGGNTFSFFSKDYPFLSCFDWSQDKFCHMTIALGCSTGAVNLINLQNETELTINTSSKYKRPCTELSWNPVDANKLAAGFDKQRSEFCAVVWDLNAVASINPNEEKDSSRGITSELSRDTTSSLAWLPHHSELLAVGTVTGWLRVFDTRTQTETLNIMAHIPTRPRKVVGIRPDPFQQGNLIATFSDSAGEPVKVWDLRKIVKSSSVPLFTIDPFHYIGGSQRNPQSAVTDVSWSTARASVVAVSCSFSKTLPFYSLTLGNTKFPTTGTLIKLPLFTMPIEDTARSLSCQSPPPTPTATATTTTVTTAGNPRDVTETRVTRGSETSTATSASTTYNKLLVGTASGCYSINIQESVPLAVSANNDLVYGTGRILTLLSTSTSTMSHPATPDPTTSTTATATATSTTAAATIDIDAIMKGRCQSGYSLDAMRNSQILYLESDTDAVLNRHKSLHKKSTDSPKGVYEFSLTVPLHNMRSQDLSRVWAWIGRNDMRYEAVFQRQSLMSPGGRAVVDGGKSPMMLTLATCGVLTITERGRTAAISSAKSSATGATTGATMMSMEGGSSGAAKPPEKMKAPPASAPAPSARDTESRHWHPALGCYVYLSEHRSLARSVCGWSNMIGISPPSSNTSTNMKTSENNNEDDDDEDDEDAQQVLYNLITDINTQDGCERAVAIALLHGNVALAIQLLTSIIENSQKAQALKTTNSNSQFLEIYSNDNEDGQNKEELEINYNLSNNKDVGDSESSDSENGINDFPFFASEEDLSPGYLSVLSLVAMFIAGFTPNSLLTTAASNSTVRSGGNFSHWLSMSDHILCQLEAFFDSRPAVGYLYCCCQFLICLSSSSSSSPTTTTTTDRKKQQEGVVRGSTPATAAVSALHLFDAVLSDENISVEDRVAIACSLLNNDELHVFLTNLRDTCKLSGNLEGLVVTGLQEDGIKIIQKYLDVSNDIQTAALLSCQISEQIIVNNNNNSSLQKSSNMCSESYKWLFQYRQLLNKWQLFVERAQLDVELGKSYRDYMTLRAAQEKAAATAASNNNSNRGTGTPGGGHPGSRGGGAGSTGDVNRGQHMAASNSVSGSSSGSSSNQSAAKLKSNAERLLYSLPPMCGSPHLYLTCNFCSTTLPVDALQKQNQSNTSLNRKNAIITRCSHCKNPLPRCYVCLLFLGLVNPQNELKSALKRKNNALLSQPLQQDPNSKGGEVDVRHPQEEAKTCHNVLSVGQWFMWCQNCKHGGHALCLDEWFCERSLCGVNGCNCRCMISK